MRAAPLPPQFSASFTISTLQSLFAVRGSYSLHFAPRYSMRCGGTASSEQSNARKADNTAAGICQNRRRWAAAASAAAASAAVGFLHVREEDALNSADDPLFHGGSPTTDQRAVNAHAVCTRVFSVSVFLHTEYERSLFSECVWSQPVCTTFLSQESSRCTRIRGQSGTTLYGARWDWRARPRPAAASQAQHDSNSAAARVRVSCGSRRSLLADAWVADLAAHLSYPRDCVAVVAEQLAHRRAPVRGRARDVAAARRVVAVHVVLLRDTRERRELRRLPHAQHRPKRGERPLPVARKVLEAQGERARPRADPRVQPRHRLEVVARRVPHLSQQARLEWQRVEVPPVRGAVPAPLGAVRPPLGGAQVVAVA
mmetsp:Transcript_24608/g.73543  ORF Transcript_24608/g.73543 Transcript_24608/m.73543 type:complete len:370 (-) Transcript_24608:476-1585(-)